MSLVPNARRTRNQIVKASFLKSSQNENLPPIQGRKPLATFANKANIIQANKANIIQANKISIKVRTKPTFGVKRKADAENCEIPILKVAKKRSAFGDITNAIEKTLMKNSKTDALKGKIEGLKGKTATTKKPVPSSLIIGLPKINNSELLQKDNKCLVQKSDSKSVNDSLDESIIVLSQELKITKHSLEHSSYITAPEDSPLAKDTISTSDQKDYSKPPSDVEDFDRLSLNDPYAVSLYATDIFNYYKKREDHFLIEHYITRQPDISRTMRAILVDWMVEVQESFELNHETLYLAVKLVDLYLTKVVIKRDRLQLIGSAAIFIACKFDERSPPYIDDFLYICDDAYSRRELIGLEIEVLKTLEYDLGIPLSYRFLRRYARCSKVNMETLTFARYILELSLMDYEFIEVIDSLLAAAALFLALSIKEDVSEWSNTNKYYSGYELEDFYHFVQLLHQMLVQPPKDHLKTIKNKYSHKVFFEVAKIVIPEKLNV